MNPEKTILMIIAEVSGEVVSPEYRLDDLPLDSLEFIEVLLEIDKQLGVKIPSESAADMVLVSDLVEFASARILNA